MNKRYETRAVLAGAYKGKKTLLTHLTDTAAGNDVAMCGSLKYELCDIGGLPPEQHYSRPTCPKCARHWDKVQTQKSTREQLSLDVVKARRMYYRAVKDGKPADEVKNLQDHWARLVELEIELEKKV